jgi:hypothetical protein
VIFFLVERNDFFLSKEKHWYNTLAKTRKIQLGCILLYRY